MGIMKHEGETRAWRAHGEQNNNRRLGGPSGHAWTGRDASKAESNLGPMAEQAAPGAMAEQGS